MTAYFFGAMLVFCVMAGLAYSPDWVLKYSIPVGCICVVGAMILRREK